MTTRRRRPGPPGPPRGRMGLFGRSAMATSVKPCQSGIDLDRAAQGAGERAPGSGPLEARQPPAGVDAAALEPCARGQDAVAGDEANELALGSPAAAPGAGPNRLMGQEDRPPPRC